MPFGDIVVNTKTYSPREPGYYMLSTVAFGSPSNEFRIRGARPSKDGYSRGSVTRYIEIDVTSGGSTVRKNALLTLSLAVPVDGSITVPVIDTAVSDISEFLTTATLSRLMQGES